MTWCQAVTQTSFHTKGCVIQWLMATGCHVGDVWTLKDRRWVWPSKQHLALNNSVFIFSAALAQDRSVSSVPSKHCRRLSSSSLCPHHHLPLPQVYGQLTACISEKRERWWLFLKDENNRTRPLCTMTLSTFFHACATKQTLLLLSNFNSKHQPTTWRDTEDGGDIVYSPCGHIDLNTGWQKDATELHQKIKWNAK